MDDVEQVVAEVAWVLAPGGAFCFDTFNRTFLSRVLVAWLVERSLRREARRLDASAAGGVIHEWRKFLKPAELAATMSRHGLVPGEVVGIRLARMGRGGFELEAGGGTRVAYLGHATRRRGVVGSSSSRGGE